MDFVAAAITAAQVLRIQIHNHELYLHLLLVEEFCPSS
jgi:hypothetical protein